MKYLNILLWTMLAIGWVILLGGVAPALISQPDTGWVTVGVALLLGYAFATYVAIDLALKRRRDRILANVMTDNTTTDDRRFAEGKTRTQVKEPTGSPRPSPPPAPRAHP